MMRDKEKNEFEKFLKDIELVNAPDSFTDKVLDKYEAKLKEQKIARGYFKFWMIYGTSILASLVAVFSLSTGNETSVSQVYFESLRNYMSNISIPEFNLNISIFAVLGLLTIFILLLVDNSLNNRRAYSVS